jgi:Uma2 family endonuclease
MNQTLTLRRRRVARPQRIRQEEPYYSPQRLYTYEDYLSWPEGFRAEIYNGEVLSKAVPNPIHQEIIFEICGQLGNYLRKTRSIAKVYPAPFAVRLFPHQDSRDTLVLEPDITVVLDPSRITNRGLLGAPDMVIEVLSPSTGDYDQNAKKRAYQSAGVREYWIVDPDEKRVEVYLQDDEYQKCVYSKEAVLSPTVFPGLEVALAEVFA